MGSIGRFLQSSGAAVVITLLISPFAYVEAAKQQATDYLEIEWVDLIPDDDLEALLNPPDYISEIQDGSEQDQLENASDIAEANDAANDRYQQALVSTRVRPEYDKKNVKLPGFIVPLSFNDEMIVTEFFLVPFFGACIHVPPPPPNQMIHVSYDKGIDLNSLYDAYIIEGALNLKRHDGGEMGSAAYGISVHKIYLYE